MQLCDKRKNAKQRRENGGQKNGKCLTSGHIEYDKYFEGRLGNKNNVNVNWHINRTKAAKEMIAINANKALTTTHPAIHTYTHTHTHKHSSGGTA